MYRGTVRPHLDYGSPAWSTHHCEVEPAGTGQSAKPGPPHHHWCNAVNADQGDGTAHSTTISQSPERSQAHFVQAEKFRWLPSMMEQLNSLTKYRLKRGSVVHESKRLFPKHEGSLSRDTLPLCPSDRPELRADNQPDIKVFTSVPYVIPGVVQDNRVKQVPLAGHDC